MNSKITDYSEIISNVDIDIKKADFAIKIIAGLQNDIQNYVENGCGPFVAAVYDEGGNLVAKCANTVVNDNCSNSHAEINVIKKAQEIFNTYDLSKYNLSLYVTSEPCMMCLGAILWSGIKAVYFGVPSVDVEKITGYDEGYKPNWIEEFFKKGVIVYGNIESEIGKKALNNYILEGNIIYKPSR